MAFVSISDPSGGCEVTCSAKCSARRVYSVGRRTRTCWSRQIYRIQGEACGSRRRTWPRWIRLRPAPVQRSNVVARRPRRCHTSGMCWRGTAGKGRVVLVPLLDGARQVEIALPGGYSVTPRLAQALLASPGVQRVEEI